jgi:cytochrome b pre-mRNA-processing protein 3
MKFLDALSRALGAAPSVPAPGEALYARAVATARQPEWYLAGEVPDSYDGRFDMLALVIAYVTIRLEALGELQLCADLTERFIADMDGTLRQDGVGDQVVGKHIGRMVAALGGRLGAYRDAGADDSALAEALRRNLWRGAEVAEDAVAFVVARVRRFEALLAATPGAALASGHWEDTR